MAAQQKALGSTTITKSFAITLIRKVRNHMKINTGDTVGFYMTEDENFIIIPSTISKLTGTLELLGASILTSSSTVTLPRKVRKILNVVIGDTLVYYPDSPRRIRLAK